MAKIQPPELNEREVLKLWKILCADHGEYFEKYSKATRFANQASSDASSDRGFIFGRETKNANEVGKWCMDFMDYHFNEESSETYKILDRICDWWIEGDDQ
jgi:hypothetical protein